MGGVSRPECYPAVHLCYARGYALSIGSVAGVAPKVSPPVFGWLHRYLWPEPTGRD